MVPLPVLGMGGLDRPTHWRPGHLHQAQTWVSRPGELVDDGGSYTWGTMLVPPKLSWEVAPIPPPPDR